MLADPVFLALTALAVVLIGVSKGGFGGGLAMLAVPILSLHVDPRAAAAVVLPLLIVGDMFTIWAFRFQWHRDHLRVLLVGSLIGIVIGALTFDWVSESAMRLIVGGSGLLYFVLRFVLPKLTRVRQCEASWRQGGLWGAVAGFTSFTAHAGGPPVQLYLLPRNLTKTEYQGTTTALFTAINLLKVGPYVWLGQLDGEALRIAAAFVPLAAVAVWCGWWLHRRIDELWFYRIANGLLAVTSLKLLVDGTRGLLAAA